jgi:hypothetical protein
MREHGCQTGTDALGIDDLNQRCTQSGGMEETLTMHRLHLPSKLRRTLSSTNLIESAFRPWKRCAGM